MQTHAAVQTDTEGEDAGVRPVMVDAESQCRGNSFPRVRRDEAQRLVDTAPDLAAEVERLRGYVHQLKLEDGERLAKVEELTKEVTKLKSRDATNTLARMANRSAAREVVWKQTFSHCPSGIFGPHTMCMYCHQVLSPFCFHVAHITPIAGISQMLEAKESELNERRLSGWELQQQEEYIEDLRIASGRPSFSGADDASLRSTLRNMVVVHPACNEKHEQECQAAGHPIDMCECL